MITISCIIPVRNRRDLVVRAIDSVFKQDIEAIEVVVIDDASTDGTSKEIKRHFGERVTIQNTKRPLGPGPARNLGVSISSGQVLMFLDSDDIWLKGHCRLLLDTLGNGFDVAYGITENLDEINGNRFFIPEKGTPPSGCTYGSLLRWCFLVPSAFALRRETFMKSGGFKPLSPGEDWFFFLELARLAPFGFVKEVITLRHLHNGSLCRTHFDRKWVEVMVKSLKKASLTAGCRQSQVSRLENILYLTKKDGHKWQSVQDWYTNLKRHKLL